MVPKWSQNLSKINPGGALEATWEPPLKQGASKTSFLMILAPFWYPLWDQFELILGIIFFNVFLKWLFDGLGLHLGSQNTSKMRPKRGSTSRLEIHWFWLYLQHLSHIWGCWKSAFFDVFLEHRFGMAFGAHFGDFWFSFGVPFGDNFVTFGAPFLHQFLDTLKKSKREPNERGRPVSAVDAPPLLE